MMEIVDPRIRYLNWLRQNEKDPRREIFSCTSVEELPNGGTKQIIFGGQRTEWRNKEGLLHREDGPAIEDTDGYQSFWLNGIKQENENV